MNSVLYQKYFSKEKKIFALLIDPGKSQPVNLAHTLESAEPSGVDIILVGGSLTSMPVDKTIESIREKTSLPVILFPGNLLQLSPKADGILLLSLLSGRNPEYLIGNHVIASQYLKNTGLELIPTGYILVDGQNLTSVEYMSNTRPIPSEKADIIMATALAGEQLGLKLIYLEAGSGASKTVGSDIVSFVRENISIPLIVGGGIRTPEDVREIYKAGANGVVVGTAIEKDFGVLSKLTAVKSEFN
jgi:putative glycerol-1-phosphate prenyltransferase